MWCDTSRPGSDYLRIHDSAQRGRVVTLPRPEVENPQMARVSHHMAGNSLPLCSRRRGRGCQSGRAPRVPLGELGLAERAAGQHQRPQPAGGVVVQHGPGELLRGGPRRRPHLRRGFRPSPPGLHPLRPGFHTPRTARRLPASTMRNPGHLAALPPCGAEVWAREHARGQAALLAVWPSFARKRIIRLSIRSSSEGLSSSCICTAHR